MKILHTLMLFLAIIALIGCKPDLVVESLELSWEEDSSATAIIKNIGNKDAGAFMVYFDAEENPVSPNHRPQVRHNVTRLAKGASVTLVAEFGPLAHPDNQNLQNVYEIKVLADPKGMIDELKEDNNEANAPISFP